MSSRRLVLILLITTAGLSPTRLIGREITGLAFTPDGKTLIASGGNDIRFIAVSSLKESRKFEAHANGVTALALSPNGKRLATTGGGSVTLRIWDVQSGKELHALADARETMTAVAFSPDSKTLASASYAGTGSVLLWAVEKGERIRSIAMGETWPTSVAFSPDGKRVFTAGSAMNALTPGFRVSDGDEARGWDIETGKSVSRVPGKGMAVAVAGDGDGVLALAGYGIYLVGPMEPAQIRINQVGMRPQVRMLVWNLAANREILSLDGFGMVAFSPDGRFLAVAGGPQRRALPRAGVTLGGPSGNPLPPQIIEVATGKSILSPAGIPGTLTAAAFSPDGRRLGVGFADGSVRVIDLAPSGFDPAQVRDLQRERVDQLWDALGQQDAIGGYGTIWKLSEAGDAALASAGERLRPRKMETTRIAQLLTDLESRRFATRDSAFKELQKLGNGAEAEVRQALKGQPSVDARKKLEELAAVFDQATLSGERLMQTRGVLVLERIGTTKAREILQELARNSGDAFVGREARAALRRLEATNP